MRRRMMWIWAAGLPVLLFAALTAAQEYLWVTSGGAQLKADRGSTSATVAELPVGSKLTVLVYRQRWYQVTTPEGNSGWIYRGKVSKQPPAAQTADSGDGSVGNMLGGISGSNGIQVSAAGTSRSVRGLSSEAAAYAQKTDTPKVYRQALDQVLAVTATDAQINWFLKTAKIGEYAD